MTVAFKSTSSPQHRPSRPVHLPATQGKVVPLEQARKKRVTASLTNPVPFVNSPSPRSTPRVVKVQPLPQPQPLWLSSMMALQRVSSVFTSLIIGSTLTVYGLTVYGESSWTQEYPRLEQLRLQEQQLRATQEVLKNEIAITADGPTTGLVVPQPGDMIYVEPAAPRPEQSVAPTPLLELNHSANSEVDKPLGY